MVIVSLIIVMKIVCNHILLSPFLMVIVLIKLVRLNIFRPVLIEQ